MRLLWKNSMDTLKGLTRILRIIQKNNFIENYDESLLKLGNKISDRVGGSISDFGNTMDDVINKLETNVTQVVKQTSKDYSCSNKEEMELIKELKKLV